MVLLLSSSKVVVALVSWLFRLVVWFFASLHVIFVQHGLYHRFCCLGQWQGWLLLPLFFLGFGSAASFVSFPQLGCFCDL